LIQALIGAKWDVNARNLKQETPLMLAANLRQMEVVRLLIASGADVTLRDQYGNNASFHTIFGPRAPSLFPQPVTRQGLISLLQRLKAAGLDLNSKNDRDGDTLLTIHIGRGERTEEWGDLIDLGVNVNGVNQRGESVLIKTVRSGAPDEGRIRRVKLLLGRGADPLLKDTDGFTALDYLRQGRVQRAKYPEAVRNIDETIKLLESAIDN
jgi:ankyrin repeat protein